MKSLGSYTLGDQYVSPERRLSAMLTQQGSKGGPSNSWQETMGRIAQQLAGAYIGYKDTQNKNKAFDAQTGLEPDSTSMKQTYTPEQVQGFASKLHGGVSDSFEPNKGDLAASSLDGHIAPNLPNSLAPSQIEEEQFFPPQSSPQQQQASGSGFNRPMPDFSQAHQLNSQAGVPNADPRQAAVNLMQGNQTEQLNEKMNPRDFSMQQLRGLENNPYAKRILAQMMMQNADRDYASGLAETQRGYVDSDYERKRKADIEDRDKKLEANKKNAELKNNSAGDKTSFTQEDKLRTAFIKGSGDFVKVRDAYGRIRASATDPSPAGDLALIFNYMKVLDPGSTVREGEFATAANSASIPDRLIAQYNKVVNGERLAPAQRTDFVGRAGDLYAQQETFYKGHEGRYRELANSYGLNADNVVYGLNQGLPEDTTMSENEKKELEELRKWKSEQPNQ